MRTPRPEGLIEIPVDGDIAIRANTLSDFPADPADRIIVATAHVRPPAGDGRRADPGLGAAASTA